MYVICESFGRVTLRNPLLALGSFLKSFTVKLILSMRSFWLPEGRTDSFSKKNCTIVVLVCPKQILNCFARDQRPGASHDSGVELIRVIPT